ncbi:MAG: leucine-rich repeat protein [archaeon]|nr:leucine-rich repeat protein [archaeon]
MSPIKTLIPLAVLAVFALCVCPAAAAEEVQEYTVVYEIDGIDLVMKVRAGEVLDIPLVPTKKPSDGKVYTFEGWAGYTEGMVVDGDLRFVAMFRVDEIRTVTIHYDDGETVVLDVARGSTIDPPREPYKYFKDPEHTAVWSSKTKVFNDMELYAAVSVSGVAGDNASWTLDYSTGTLKIAGTGPTYDWSAKSTPWYQFRSYIVNLEVGEGITYLGDYAAYKYSSLAEVVLPDSLVALGETCIVTSSLEHLVVGSGLKELALRSLDGMELTDRGEKLQIRTWNLVNREFVGKDGVLEMVKVSGRSLGVTWTLDRATDTLYFAGQGTTSSYTSVLYTPWYQIRGMVEHVVVEEGVTALTSYTFYTFPYLKDVVLADSVSRLDANCLRGCPMLSKIVFGAGLETVSPLALLGYTFTDGKSVLKVTPANLAGKTFEGADKVFCEVASKFRHPVVSVVEDHLYTTLPTLADIGSIVNFKVGVEDTYSVENLQVRIDGTLLTAVKGVYSFVMPEGGVEIVVTGDVEKMPRPGIGMSYDDYVAVSEDDPVDTVEGSIELVWVGKKQYLHAVSVGSGSVLFADGSRMPVEVGKAALDVIMITGQSNAAYFREDPSLATVPVIGTAYYYGTHDYVVDSERYYNDADPSLYSMLPMVNSYGALVVGNIEPSLAAGWYSETGHKMYVINTGWGGRSIPWFNPTYGVDRLTVSMKSVYNDAMAAIDKDLFDVNVLGYLWIQGETSHTSSGVEISKEKYMSEFLASYRWITGQDLLHTFCEDSDYTPKQCYISLVRQQTFSTNSMAAQIELAEKYDDIHIATTVSHTFTVENGMMCRDDLHYSQLGDNMIGAAVSKYIAENMDY